MPGTLVRTDSVGTRAHVLSAAETVPIANETSERVARAMVLAVSPAALLLSLGAVIEWVTTHRKYPRFSRARRLDSPWDVVRISPTHQQAKHAA